MDLLEAAMPSLGHGRLVTYPRLGHSLRPVLDDVVDRVVAFLAELDKGRGSPGRSTGTPGAR